MRGNDPYHFPMMYKYKTIPKIFYFIFCKSVGHDDNDFRTLEMMRERNSYTYDDRETCISFQQDVATIQPNIVVIQQCTIAVQQCATAV
jgi:hypothetical protein